MTSTWPFSSSGVLGVVGTYKAAQLLSKAPANRNGGRRRSFFTDFNQVEWIGWASLARAEQAVLALLVQRGVLIQINHNAHLKHRIRGFQVLIISKAENLATD